MIKFQKKPNTTEPLAPFENARAKQLGKIVSEIIASQPFELDGYQWAAMSQAGLVAKTGIPLRTLQRLIDKPPFVRERTHDPDGSIVTLLRVGKPGPKTPRHLANIMANVYRKKYGRRPSDEAFGCLVGLASIWPAGAQVDIFKTILAKDSEFMGIAKLVLEIREDEGGPKFMNKKWNWLPITLVRIDCVAEAAVDFYIMEMQHKSKPVPDCVKAMKPEVWPQPPSSSCAAAVTP